MPVSFKNIVSIDLNGDFETFYCIYSALYMN